MYRTKFYTVAILLSLGVLLATVEVNAQPLPPKYPMLELFTNTPCPICGSQNPGFFNRLEAYEGEYHLVSFYPGKPYASCIFYQANISENSARLDFYPMVFGTPTVAINGLDFRSSGSVSNTVLDNITGMNSWLSVTVEETIGSTRTVTITLEDHVGGSLSSGTLYAVIVEREIMYNAPNGETLHHNVFRRFLTPVDGETVDLGTGMATRAYQYTLDGDWQPDEIHVVAWLMDPDTKEIYNSGTRFDPVLSGTNDLREIPALAIYPNPASDQVSVRLPDGGHGTLRVYDGAGQMVCIRDASHDSAVRMDVASWPAGSYYVEVRSEEAVLQGRFIVE
jgi:hypothetical protein